MYGYALLPRKASTGVTPVKADISPVTGHSTSEFFHSCGSASSFTARCDSRQTKRFGRHIACASALNKSGQGIKACCDEREKFFARASRRIHEEQATSNLWVLSHRPLRASVFVAFDRTYSILSCSIGYLQSNFALPPT